MTINDFSVLSNDNICVIHGVITYQDFLWFVDPFKTASTSSTSQIDLVSYPARSYTLQIKQQMRWSLMIVTFS